MTNEDRPQRAPGRDAALLTRTQHMIARLEALEKREAAAALVHHRTWLVGTGYMPVVARYWLLPPQRRLPGLPRVKAMGLVRRWLSPFAPRVHLHTGADAIQLSDDGNRLRALYLGDEPRSIKLVAVGRRQDMRPDQEVERRARVAALGTIRVPNVFASRVEDGIVITEEELVLGRRLMVRYDLPFIRNVLVPKLLATYRAAGLTYEPLSSHVPADLPERLPPGAFRDAVARLLARAPDAAISFCHGDFLPSNIVVTGNDAVLMDWENAGRGIAAFDLLTLALRYHANRALFAVVADAIRSHLAERGARFEDLLLLALASRAARRPDSYRKISAQVLDAAMATGG
jgi:hypothetical protein